MTFIYGGVIVLNSQTTVCVLEPVWTYFAEYVSILKSTYCAFWEFMKANKKKNNIELLRKTLKFAITYFIYLRNY